MKHQFDPHPGSQDDAGCGVSRRHFIGALSTAASLPLLHPAGALAAEPKKGLLPLDTPKVDAST
jgi:hypothetical protein